MRRRKMKFLKVFAVMAVVVVLAGCASINTAGKSDLNGQKLTLDKKAKNIVHINADNWGLYFLWFPLLTGSTVNIGNIAILKDNVQISKVVALVTAKGKELGATNVVDLKSSRGSSGFLFNFKQVQVSGNAVK
jgi:uncharacterized protein YceK